MSERKCGAILCVVSIFVFYASCTALAFAGSSSNKDFGWFGNMNVFLLGTFGALFVVASIISFIAGFSMALEDEKDSK